MLALFLPSFPFSVLWLALTIIHGCGRAVKNGEGLAGIIHMMSVDVGGPGGGGDEFKHWPFIIQLSRFEFSADCRDSR